MSSVVRPLREPAAPPGATLTLGDWPLVDRPLSTLLVVAGVGLLGAGVGLAGADALAGAAVAAVLLAAMWRRFTPVVYEVGPQGVVHVCLGRRRRIPWSQIGQYQVRRDGVLLSPLAAPAPWAQVRGLYVRWGRRREELLAQLARYVGEEEPSPAAAAPPARG